MSDEHNGNVALSLGQSASVSDPSAVGFRHEAMLYRGDAEFVVRAADFVGDAVASGDPILVVVGAGKIDKLRSKLGTNASHVRFADMRDVGSNPAWIIPVWRDFVTEHAGEGRRLRGIGEPLYPERSSPELVECQRHESLLNLAFDDVPGFWLVCPYDAGALPLAVIDEARRSHPFWAQGTQRATSRDYRGLELVGAPFGDPLPEPSGDVTTMAFTYGPLRGLRRLVEDRARRCGLDDAQTADFVVACNEVATNSLRHGGGGGDLRIWDEPDALVCEIHDTGYLNLPMAGIQTPGTEARASRGLWLANHLCDLVQIRTLGGSTIVRLYKRKA